MDRMYLRTTIDNLEKEKELHSTKFAGQPAHANCIPNFEQAIAKLNQELTKLEAVEILGDQQNS